MTNREKLQNMSNEELGKFLGTSNNFCEICAFKETCTLISDCVKGITEWLESEVEE